MLEMRRTQARPHMNLNELKQNLGMFGLDSAHLCPCSQMNLTAMNIQVVVA